MGAGLASFDLLDRPLFRRWNGAADPFELASILLLPWSNRVSGGGFIHQGQFHPLEPNLIEPLPIHGNGFQLRWQVAGCSADLVELRTVSDGPGPYKYSAAVRYSLTPSGLRMELAVTNEGDHPLPFGLGFHPWLVRTPQTMLTMETEAVWLENTQHLPDTLVPVATKPAWDFRRSRLLPAGWINNAFSWREQQAIVEWLDIGVSMAVKAAPELRWSIIYSPSARANFFCFEPVTHPVDAYWLPGGGAANGMAVLAPRAQTAVWAEFNIVRRTALVDP